MIEDPNLSELWKTKDKIAAQFSTVKEFAEAVHHLAATRPMPPAGPTRKMIEGFPRGQSVADDDEIMLELRAIRAKMLADHGGDIKKLFASFRTEPEKPAPQKTSRKKISSFRSAKSIKHHRKET
jgi:hypothetical protein